MSDTREQIVNDLAKSLRRRGVSGWLSAEPVALAKAIVNDLLSTRMCDYQEDSVRGDIGGPCRKLLGHTGDHDPFERIVPDSLRETFGLAEMRVDGPVVIVQCDTDPGDMGEPRIVHADDETIVFVPSFDLWPDDQP